MSALVTSFFPTFVVELGPMLPLFVHFCFRFDFSTSGRFFSGFFFLILGAVSNKMDEKSCGSFGDARKMITPFSL